LAATIQKKTHIENNDIRDLVDYVYYDVHARKNDPNNLLGKENAKAERKRGETICTINLNMD
jgi:hypothetical protein